MMNVYSLLAQFVFACSAPLLIWNSISRGHLPLCMNCIWEDSSHARKILCPLSNQWCLLQNDAQIFNAKTFQWFTMTQKPMILQVANVCGKQSWPNLRNTDIFYLDWERHHFLMFPVRWNFCWKDSLQMPTHGISEMKYDPWQLLAEIGVVLTGLSAGHLLNSSCDFHDCVNFTQCLVPSQVWMCVPSGSSFRVSRPPSQLAPLLVGAGCLAVPWNPTPWFMKDADPIPGLIPACSDEAVSCCRVHNHLWVVKMINWYSQRHWYRDPSLSLVSLLYNYQT